MTHIKACKRPGFHFHFQIRYDQSTCTIVGNPLPNFFMPGNVSSFMKSTIILAAMGFLSAVSFGQQTALQTFNAQRNTIDKNAFKILGAYSAANVVYGSIASAQTTGSNKYFHQMNAFWNGVTLGIATIGYLTRKPEGDISLNASLQKQHSTEKLFLLNAGLDLAYIAGGAYIYERGKTATRKPERLKGYGQSVMLQGGVLLVFDAVLYAIHNRHGRKLNSLTYGLQLSATSNGVGLMVNL